MLFKDLKSGFPVHLFDRATRQYKQGKVMSVSPPHPDMDTTKKPSMMPPMPGMPNYNKLYVDVCVQTEDGNQNTYLVVDTEQSAYHNTLVISCSKENIINEVNALKTQAEDVLGKVPEFEKTVEDCNKLLETLDTSFREQQATDKRLSKLEEEMAELLKFVKSKT